MSAHPFYKQSSFIDAPEVISLQGVRQSATGITRPGRSEHRRRERPDVQYQAQTAFGADSNQVLLDVVAILLEELNRETLTRPDGAGGRKVTDHELVDRDGLSRDDRQTPEFSRSTVAG